MKYLEKIGFSKDDIAYMMENTPEKFIELLKEQKKLVTENISYLKDLGVTNYQDIFLKFDFAVLPAGDPPQHREQRPG